MRAISALILLTLPIGCHSNPSANAGEGQVPDAVQAIRLFPKATEVRLFVDTGRTDSKHHIVLSPSQGHLLTRTQRNELEGSLVWNSNYGKEDIAACFMPHHFFRYFDEKHQIVGEIAVCFCCGGVQVDKADGTAIYPDSRLNIHDARLKELVRSMHEPTDIECGPGDG